MPDNQKTIPETNPPLEKKSADDATPSAGVVDGEDVAELLSGLGIDPDAEPDELVSVLLTKIVSQSTSGPYPPPMMLKEYKDIDPKIVDEILDGAKSQREHRMALENRVTDASQERQTRAQNQQTAIAVTSMIVGAALAAFPPFFEVSVPSVIPISLIAIGVGGRPVATILTKLIAREKD